MFSKDPAAKTAEANIVAKKYGISDKDLAEVEDYKKELTEHNAWDLPFMGYVNEDGYGYAYVPDQAITETGWNAHKAFRAMPHDAQTAFAIRMLFTHRDATATRRHVPALRARLQRALRGCRLEQLLNSGIGAPEGSRTREPPSATHAQHATVLLVRESVVFCLSCLLRPKGRGKQRNGGFA